MYRYELTIMLQTELFNQSPHLVAFLMCNPSVATHEKNDPTVARCVDFANRWGYSGLVVQNLDAYITPYPTELGQVQDPVGPENDRFIQSLADRKIDVVCAWGVQPLILPRSYQVARMLQHTRLWCLGTTGRGYPKHPLYLKRDTKRVRWSPQ